VPRTVRGDVKTHKTWPRGGTLAPIHGGAHHSVVVVCRPRWLGDECRCGAVAARTCASGRRGPIGADGRHVVRIAINPDQPEERAEFEVREDRILLDAA
jgi:hypothetical protein